MKTYSHYCSCCKKYFTCTHPDPEKVEAFCPDCKVLMFLRGSDISTLILRLRLCQDEIGLKEVDYREIK